MPETRRIRITHVHPSSAHYESRTKYIGLIGVFKPSSPHDLPGYYTGWFYPDGGDSELFFRSIRYKRI